MRPIERIPTRYLMAVLHAVEEGRFEPSSRLVRTAWAEWRRRVPRGCAVVWREKREWSRS